MNKIRQFLLEKKAGQLPAAVPETVPAIRPPMPVTLKKPAPEFDAQERALRDEKCLFVKMVYDEAARNPALTWPAACDQVTLRDGRLFSKLQSAGNHDESALTAGNFYVWRKQLGFRRGIMPDFANRNALLRNYGNPDKEREGDPDFWKLVENAFLNSNKPKLAKIHRRAATVWMQKYPDRKIPSYTQVNYYLNKHLPPRLLDLARRGEAYYAQKYRDYIERDPDTIRPNECWVADTQDADFYIRVVDADGIEKAVRAKLCAIFDVKTLFAVSLQLVPFAVNNTVIRNGFAYGVSRFGRPRVFYIDNGADYKALGFTRPVRFTPNVDNSEVYEHYVMKELDVEVRFALPYNPQSKAAVERFFREAGEACYAMQRGYVGNCPANRPATAEVWSKPENVKYLLSEGQACARIDQFIADYHRTPGKGKFLNGLTPEAAFAPQYRLTRPQLTDDEYFLAFLRPLPTSRIVNPRGPSVQVGKMRFVAVEPKRLWHYDGKPVMVKFDNLSTERCFLFELSGKPICECRTPQWRSYFARTEEEKALLTADRRRIGAERKELQTMLRAETGGFHKLDPESIFLLEAEQKLTGSGRPIKLDSMHSVKGETHNPSIYIMPAEKIAETVPEVQKTALPPPKANDEFKRKLEATLAKDSSVRTEEKPAFDFEINNNERGAKNHEAIDPEFL